MFFLFLLLFVCLCCWCHGERKFIYNNATKSGIDVLDKLIRNMFMQMPIKKMDRVLLLEPAGYCGVQFSSAVDH